MKNITTQMELYAAQVTDLLQLIAGCDAIIERMLQIGIAQDSSPIRQEKYLKHRYCEELTAIFHSFNAKIQAVEEELPLPKAA
jgi:hypothetical protein